MSSWVYYLQEKGGGPVKIGTSTNMDSRTRTLQTSTWRDIVEVARERGGKDVEDARHSQFDHLRIRPDREWFDPGEDLMAHIAQLQAGHISPTPRGPSPVWGFLAGALLRRRRRRRRRRWPKRRGWAGMGRRSVLSLVAVFAAVTLGRRFAPAQTDAVLSLLSSMF